MSAAKVAGQILDRIAIAERIAVVGTHDHGLCLRAALESEWPSIKWLLQMQAGNRASPSDDRTAGTTSAPPS
jgi:hypothetical protein